MFIAVYRWHGATVIGPYETLAEAVAMLQIGAEFGELAAVGVYDSEANVIHLPRESIIPRERLRGLVVEALALDGKRPGEATFTPFPEDEE